MRRVLCVWLTCIIPVGLWAATDEQIEAARHKGIEFLKSQQLREGNWEYPNYTTGITALCTLALVENGLALNDPVVDKGYRYIKKQAAEVKNTYEIALSILLLARLGDRQDRTLIRNLGARLLAGQNKGGGWSYNCPVVDLASLGDPKRVARRDGLGDNSCTQFAVLGLWVASRYGLPIDAAMVDVAQRFIEGQLEDGGWSYQPPHMPNPSNESHVKTRNTMTCAGLFCLTVARAAKIRQQLREQGGAVRDRSSEKQTLLADPTYAKGFERVGQFARGISTGSSKYFLWSVERLGVLLGLEKIGNTDWFATGAEALVKTQRADGSWSEGKDALSDTSFAILFLRKANLGSDISRLLEGEPEQPFLNLSSSQRYVSLQEALAAARAGDIIRIDSNGPFKFNNDVITRDITLMAGYGYDPVFEYDVGTNELGLRRRPERDPEAQYLLKVHRATLTLEGLRIQFDPPPVSQNLPWKAILVEDGNLRLLNCTISESNKRGMTAIVLVGHSQAEVRNSHFIGGKSVVEVTPSGQPQTLLCENSIWFAPIGVVVTNHPQQPAQLQLKLRNCCLQTGELISCAHVRGNLAVQATECLFKCDSLSLGFLPSPNSKEGRSWSGRDNVYNVTQWFGSGGRKVHIITDVKSHMQFWGQEDNASNKTIALNASRRLGQFSHNLHPYDWDLSEKSELALATVRYGILALTVGPGEGYSRFREDIRYNLWRKGMSLEELADLR
ncbi:MAG: hypothetical protein KatS3mg114_0720 [Planctomycetaceae bacterium]|nr:MAG: hypothetical protein KatS3mg114_0720 [Planctomycetaceae bacterium]